MSKAVCGREEAERLVAGLLAGQRGRLPPDIAIYGRAVAGLLARVPAERARAAMTRLSGLGGLPSRAEVACACGAAGDPR